MTDSLEILEFDRVKEQLADLTTCVLGRERVEQITPLFDQTAIEQALQEVSEFRDLLDYDQILPISGIVDIRSQLRKAELAGNFISPSELVEIAETLAVVRRLAKYLSSRLENCPALKSIATGLVPQKHIEAEISRCIDADTCEVNDKASPALTKIRREINSVQEQARKKLEAIVGSLSAQSVLQEDVIAFRGGRLVLVVKEEQRRKVKGLVHDRSASGASLFIEPLETLELNNRARELRIDEEKEIERILLSLTELLRESLPEMRQNVETLSELDCLYAKARLSQELDAVQPHLNVEGKLLLAQARHPLLLLLNRAEQKVVPLDVEFGESFRTLVITGPNAGGKTVALKTIGLLTVMTQCGLHIPALPHSNIAVVNSLFVDIGDQQSIESNLSTFSSHMANIRDICENASSESLVLVDEIGSGTDPEEGASLAMSVLERLTSIGSMTVVTTHQGALKAFAFRTEGVENGSMEFDVETLQPTYRFRVGIPGSSYAFEIAQRLGLPQEIIQRSRELVGEQKNKLEDLIVELETKIQKYTHLAREADLKETELRGLTKLYRERAEALRKDERKLKKQAIEESEEILRRANAAVENAIREIRERKAEREAIKKSKALLQAERAEIKRQKEEIEDLPAEYSDVVGGPISIGDRVRWQKSNATATVLSKVDKLGKVLLQAEGVRVWVPTGELVKIDSEPQKRRGGVLVHVEKRSGSVTEVDLRGLRAEEAREKVDKFLDEAAMAGLREVRVIHGKGTGRLRTAISQFLNGHPYVRSTHLGNWNEGDTGVTIVELKEE